MTQVPGIDKLWMQTLGGPEISVAVLDGPVDLAHPALRGADLQEIGAVCAPADSAAVRHGTHVTSVIFGRHDGPVLGIAPRCRGFLIPIFAADDLGQGPRCSQIELARALSLAVESGADIINISGGEFSPSGTAHPILADVIGNCSKRGILIVAAAGNQGCECLHVPGALPSVLAVGAMDVFGDPLEFSNWGGPYQTNGILAPGENIRGAEPGGGVTEHSGTSYATPIVSGVAALLLHLARRRGIVMTPLGVRDLLLQSALGCEHQTATDCRRLLAGRLNVDGAVTLLLTKEYATMADLPNPSSEGLSARTEPAAIVGAGVGSAPPGTLVVPSAEPASLNSPARTSPMDSTLTSPATAHVSPSAAEAKSQVTPADCGCGGKSRPAQLVFALGKLSFDYGLRPRRDFFLKDVESQLKAEYDRRMQAEPPEPVDKLPKLPANIDDPFSLMWYLKHKDNLQKITSIIWTLKLDDSSIYAIKPVDAFAAEIYSNLLTALAKQVEEKDERVSIPGVIAGQVRLFTGETVPVIASDGRGMYSWAVSDLIEAVRTMLKEPKPAPGQPDPFGDGIRAFFDRVYFELRNLGIAPQERALNYAATDALRAGQVFRSILADKKLKTYELDSVAVERSPLCRPDSDCWDVKLVFFNPENLQAARHVSRFTVDVSDVVPDMVGPVRSWSMR